MKDWEKIYKEKGIVQKPVLRLVKEAAALFEKRKLKRILDHGFGTGRHTILLAKKGFEVYGIEMSPEAIKITRQRLKKLGLKAHLEKSNAKSLPYKRNFFDAVVSTFVLTHGMKKDHSKAFSEIRRVLRKSGILVMTLLSSNDIFYGQGTEIEPNTFIGIPDSDGDVPHHFFTKKELEKQLPDFRFLRLEEKKYFPETRKGKATHWEIIAEKK